MKIKSKKSALLLSFTSLLLCFAMLAGSTFAWFTDTATTGVNKITSGNLHVEIQDKTGKKIENLEWVKEDGTVIANQEKILWEPGCTYLLTPFKIVNTGNLALKYKIVITGLDGDSPLLDVIKFTYKNEAGNELDISAEGHLAANGGSTGMITVSAHMDKTANNDYQDKTLENVKFTVYATQDTVEHDSKDNTYDEGAEYNPTIVTSSDEAKIALSENKENIYVDLARDVSFDVNEAENKLLGGVDTKLIVIDGKGCKLTFNNKNNNSGIVSREGTKLVIKNAVIDNSGYNEAGGTWDTHDIIFNNHNSEVQLENVTFTNAVALSGKATLTDVKISDKKATQDAYLLWIVEGSQVELNNVTIDGKSTVGKENRAIAIKDQYIPGKYGNGGNTTLTVNGLTATSDKYAAIYVTSNKATTVNLNGAIDITETAVNDTVVQSGSNSTGEITVNDNSTKVVKAASQAELANAIASVEAGKSAKVDLVADTYTLPAIAGNKRVIISGDKNTVIDMTTSGIIGAQNAGLDLTIEGATVQFANDNYKGVTHSKKLTYKDCTITGMQFLYANEVEFVNCKFVQDTDNYNVWTYGAGKVLFKDCEFSCKGKSVLLYNEGTQSAQTVEFQNCKFNASAKALGKAAIEIDSYGTQYNVIIDQATADNVTGFDKSTVWNVKRNVKPVTVTVAGAVAYNQ